MSKYLLDLHKLQHTSRKLMTGILKDFDFAIAYLDVFIIFSTNSKRASFPYYTIFEKLCTAKLSMKFSKMSFLYKRNTIPRTHPQHQGHSTITIKHSSHPEHASTQNTQTSSCLPWFSRILQKIYQELC